MTFEAIQTEYRGCLFRSRQEARWAVCLDCLDIPWRYEYEGFQFENGYRYLPDFLLPGRNLWLEVKGRKPTVGEFTNATLLAKHDRRPVVITWENFEAATQDHNLLFWYDDNGVFHTTQGWPWLKDPEPGWQAARMARFDRRPHPRPWLDWGNTEYGELPY